jgi:hypothetical protein
MAAFSEASPAFVPAPETIIELLDMPVTHVPHYIRSSMMVALSVMIDSLQEPEDFLESAARKMSKEAGERLKVIHEYLEYHKSERLRGSPWMLPRARI